MGRFFVVLWRPAEYSPCIDQRAFDLPVVSGFTAGVGKQRPLAGRKICPLVLMSLSPIRRVFALHIHLILH